MDQQPDIYDLGLHADLAMLKHSPVNRRQLLKLGAAGLSLFLTGCATASTQSAQPAASINATPATQTGASTALPTSGVGLSSPTSAQTIACVAEIPAETAGPFPADGSNASRQTLNVLTRSGIVRRDIRTSLSTGNTAQGVPLNMVLTLVNTNDGCKPLVGYAVYLWHCTREGAYSLYSNGVTGEDYLRGVQATDNSGTLTVQSVFPGCYTGRWPHVHFEIYPSLEQATGPANLVHTSQLALPQDACDTVYATDGYATSVRNLSQLSLATDNIFRDGATTQLATVSGDITKGYTAALTVGVAV